MSELKYRKELMLKIKDLNRTKNDKYVPLTMSSGDKADGVEIQPKRFVDNDTSGPLKAGDRIVHKKKSAISGRKLYAEIYGEKA